MSDVFLWTNIIGTALGMGVTILGVLTLRKTRRLNAQLERDIVTVAAMSYDHAQRILHGEVNDQAQ